MTNRPQQHAHLPQGVRAALCDGALMMAMFSNGCLLEPESDDDEDDGCEDCEPLDAEGDAADQETTPPEPPPPGPEAGNEYGCCASHPGSGCNDRGTEACVCGLDPACCTQGWDASCALTAKGLCNACGL